MNEPENGVADSSAKVNAGSYFNRWTVMEFSHKQGKQKYWKCKCACGSEKVIGEISFRYGKSTSCGCRRNEVTANRCTIHGKTGTRGYHCWANMIQRCANPKHPRFSDYGGRDIKVCDEWATFDGFFRDMGPCPSAYHSIDRFPDKNGNYDPKNCRWATTQEQAENKRNNVMITYLGETLMIGKMAEKHGLNRDVVKGRLSRGWSVSKALSTPILKTRRWHLHE